MNTLEHLLLHPEILRTYHLPPEQSKTLARFYTRHWEQEYFLSLVAGKRWILTHQERDYLVLFPFGASFAETFPTKHTPVKISFRLLRESDLMGFALIEKSIGTTTKNS